MSDQKEGVHRFAGRGGGGHGHGGLGIPVEKPKQFRKTFWRLVARFRPYRGQLAVVVLAAVLSTVFNIVSPKILGDATTAIFEGVMQKIRGVPGGGVDFPGLVRTLAILALLYVFSAALIYVQQVLMARVSQKMVYELRKEVNEKLARLPLRFFDSQPHGDILSRFINDFDNISNTLQQSVTQFITSLVTFVGVVAMMLVISPLLTAVVALTLPLSLVVTQMIARRSQGYFLGQQRALGELNGHVEEMYTGHPVVKAFGHEDKAIQTFEGINERLYDSGWKAQFVSGIIMPFMNFIGNLGFVFVSVVGGILVTRRAIQVGDVQAFIQYARLFSQPITQLASIANIIQSTMASAERVFELLDETEEPPEAASPAHLHAPQGRVEFSGVEFGYDAGTPVIRDLNLRVEPGRTVAIVGPTGAGKTTIINLLMRFYDVNAGKIAIDGVDIRDLPRSELRQLFGMVLQDTWLFQGTIRENIAYGRELATQEEIVAAARAARADGFIRTLPDGYDTVLDEEASNLSQGQKQLLTIARALLADPVILILDEATSSVDTRTELQIQQAMAALMKGRTSFVIAHRLSTIREADVILVMKEGRLVEQGTHQGLLAEGGFYAELYRSQFPGEPGRPLPAFPPA